MRTVTMQLAVIPPVARGGPLGIEKSDKSVKGEISGALSNAPQFL